MSYRLRECSECGSTMDPEEGYGGVCDECIRKKIGRTGQEGSVKESF